MTPEALYHLDQHHLAYLIRSAGYYNLKARRLKNFMEFLFEEYDGDLDRMFSEEMDVLRNKLLCIKGIGRETADSMPIPKGFFPDTS